MTRRRHTVLVVLWSLAVSIASAGCTDNPVGRLCDLGSTPPLVSEVVVASQSLDCVSRTCLRVPPNRELPPGSTPPPIESGLCTAACETDEDCDRVPESPCVTGFTCGIVNRVGPFCCRKLCVCKDYVVVPASGELETPKACDAGNPENACCNLEGRINNADYPQCRG